MLRRYIDAYAFLVEMRELYNSQNWNEREVHFSLLDLIENVSSMATIEVEPTIPCKDCKWYGKPGDNSEKESNNDV